MCHECPTTDGGPATAYGEGHDASQAEADAYRKAFEHVQQTGHTAVFVQAGSYYIGEGERPTELPRTVPPESVYDFDDVTHRLWNEYPEPLNLLLVDLYTVNQSYWLDGHTNPRSKTIGAEAVRRTGLTTNQQEWADAIADVLPERHPDYDGLGSNPLAEGAGVDDAAE